MINRQQAIDFLEAMLIEQGYKTKEDENIEDLFYAEMVVDRRGNPIINNPIESAVDIISRGAPLYFKWSSNNISRICCDKITGELQKTELTDSAVHFEQPVKPTGLNRIADVFYRIFGSRNTTCANWDNYIIKTEEQREILSDTKIIKRMVQQPVAKAGQQMQEAQQASSILNEKQKNDLLELASSSSVKNKRAVTKISKDIGLCSDGAVLKEFVRDNNLPQYIMDKLYFRAVTLEKINEMSKNPVTPVCPKPVELENGVILPTVTQPRRQNSACGCWSVSLQSMLAYHGVHLTQEEIRNFIPDTSLNSKLRQSDAAQENERNQLFKRMNSDKVNEIADYSDLIHKTVKDVALHHVSFAAGSAEELKSIVTKALKESNSPISFLSNGHYRTIVGIEGDNLLIYNPSNEYNLVNGKTVPSKEPLSTYTKNAVIVLDWLEKINPEMRPSINKTIKESKVEVLLGRREGVTTSDTTVNEFNNLIVHDVIYPKSYEDLQKTVESTDLQQKQNNYADINALDDDMSTFYQAKIDELNQNKDIDKANVKDAPEAQKKAHVLTIEERNKINNEIMKNNNLQKPTQTSLSSANNKSVEKKGKEKQKDDSIGK